jgi:hypothetical protein
MRFTHAGAAATGACLVLAASGLAAQTPVKQKPDIHFVVTRQPVVEAMLRLARVGRQDVVYDLGSGDGRIVITAASRYGARGIGVEIDTHLISVANQKARQAGVSDRVRFLREDLLTADIGSATVVTMFLGPLLHRRMRPRLHRALRPGARIVAHGWGMGEWEPDAREEVDGRQLFYWVVPADVAGTWRWRGTGGVTHALLLEQRYQRVSGRWVVGSDTVPVAAVRLAGDSISLRAAANGAVFRLVATVRGDALGGTIRRNGAPPARWVARRSR